MEFKFTIQDYQTRAADAVVSVFEGQPKVDAQTYVRDLGSASVDKHGQESFSVYDGDGYCNAPIALSSDELLDNIHGAQRKNGVPFSPDVKCDLGVVELDIEMETGTGKTYVYTETMFELNERYGWSKFVIVVPSVAIREGVAKSLATTEKHFFERYGKKLWWFVYNSSRLNEIDGFASRADISVMIINTQNFNKSMKKEGRSKESLIMFSERDEFGSRRPIDVLKATHPILIIDEPQKMGKKDGATRKGMQQFEPLFSINYSATHRERHNPVYSLDPLDAYNERLVKRIEVKGIEMKGMRGTDGYLYLQDIKVSPSKPPKAVVEFKKLSANGKIIKRTYAFDEGDDLYPRSGELEAYRNGYCILRIVPDQLGQLGYIELMNHERVYRGQIMNDSSEEDLRRIQIRETIASHLEKEETLFRRGIKCLSLFFIDEVAKYRVYNDDGSEGTGEYGHIFEEEYDAAIKARTAEPTLEDAYDPSYLRYLRSFDAHDVHKGYFSIDKKTKRFVDSKTGRGSDESDDESAYDLILRNKERLLSFEEPCRFVFSHSALREGWDNPNVFQICALKPAGKDEKGKEVGRRQEVGRGLRLCVNQEGVRQDVNVLGPDMVQKVNLLTVIASESYGSFVSGLQGDMREQLRERPRSVNEKYLFDLAKNAGSGVEMTESETKSLERFFIAYDYIDLDGQPTKKFKEGGITEDDIAAAGDEMRSLIESRADFLHQAMNAVFDSSVLENMVGNALEAKVQRNDLNDNFSKKEFQELWARINHKHAYTVSFDSKELQRKAIENINRNLTVSVPKYELVRGGQKNTVTREQAESETGFKTDARETREVAGASASGVTYDLVGEVANRATITRRSAAAILSCIHPDCFALFRVNPEEFIAKAGDAIVSEKATMVVEHIRYNRLEDSYDSTIFTENMPENMSHSFPAELNIQDYVFWDSETERDFAQHLDTSAEVCAYARLPRTFQIPTPVGNYAPDWAIAFKEGTVKHIFFVAETKGSLSTLNLKGVEKAKIECARKLFEQLAEGDVKYDFISTYDELMDKVMR